MRHPSEPIWHCLTAHWRVMLPHLLIGTTADVFPQMVTRYPWSYIQNALIKLSYMDIFLSTTVVCSHGSVRGYSFTIEGVYCMGVNTEHHMHICAVQVLSHVITGTFSLLMKEQMGMLWTACAVPTCCLPLPTSTLCTCTQCSGHHLVGATAQGYYCTRVWEHHLAN